MCAPVATLALIGTAISTAGAGFSALQAAAQNRYQAKVAERNVDLTNQNILAEQAATRQEITDHYRQSAALQGRQRAAMAAGGIDINFGSAADLQADTLMMADEDAARIYDHGAQAVRGLDIQAANFGSQAKASRQAATGALIGGVFDMGSTALGGATQYRVLKDKFGR